ncbi:MAG: FAD-binding oxidoreductase [Acidobacteria bacterium]|nr:FAD-binding oxidoreductase [Acidobacteriota bacterium]
MSSPDVVVIGGGVMGASIALELSRNGRTVLVVDKGGAPGAGSTSASSAIIRFTYSNYNTILMAWESAQHWFKWNEFVGAEDPDGMAKYVQTGYLVFLTEGYDGVRQRELWDQFGIPYELLSPEQVRDRWPAFETGKFYPPKSIEDPAFADDPYDQLWALYDPLSGFMDDPMLAAHNLAHAARLEGAEFRFHTEVVEIRRDADRVIGVTLAGGEQVDAPIVINAAGPHAAKINRMAGVYGEMKVHHQPLRQEVFSPPAPKGFRLEDDAPIVADLDLGQYFRPHMGDLLNVGTTEPACDPLHFIEDADDWNDSTTVEFFERVMLRLARRLPDFGIPLKPLGIGALYDVTDDWIPLYDKTSLGGFFMACGTSGNQFKNAPLVGKFMRALIEAAERGVDHDVDPVKVVGAHTGQEIDLSAFSRLRTQAVTAGNVMG